MVPEKESITPQGLLRCWKARPMGRAWRKLAYSRLRSWGRLPKILLWVRKLFSVATGEDRVRWGRAAWWAARPRWAARPLCLGRAAQAPVSRGLAAARDALLPASPVWLHIALAVRGHVCQQGGWCGSAGAVTLAVSPAQSFSVPSLRWWEVLSD